MIGISNYGKEYLTRRAFGSVGQLGTLQVGLYDDHSDQLSDSDDVGAITTEPDDGNYGRLSYTVGGGNVALAANANGDWELVFAEQAIDVENTTGVVDAWFVTGEFAADGETSATEHLLGAAALRNPDGPRRDRDLNSLLELTFVGSMTQTG